MIFSFVANRSSQTYLSSHTEDESFGHICLGRSFAMEIGGGIPQTDHRLSESEHSLCERLANSSGAIDADSIPVNTASDFMAQYTGRQEYRFTDPAHFDQIEVGNALQLSDHLSKLDDAASATSQTENTVIDAIRHQSSHHIGKALVELDARIMRGEMPDFKTVREILRLTASLLCRLKDSEHRDVIRLFIKIPFAIFTKQVIKLGLSLWMGVIQENETLDSAVFTEIILNWKESVEHQKGVFDNTYMK